MSTPTGYLQSLDAVGFVDVRFDDWTSYLEPNFHAMLNQINGNRETLFRRGVPEKHLNDFAESLSARRPISLYRPSSRAAKVLTTVANELIWRMDEGFRQPPVFQSVAPINPATLLEEQGVVA